MQHATSASKSRSAVDREFMYIGSAGPGRADGRTADGRTGGRQVPGHGRADGRADGRAAGTILNDSTTTFIGFHKETSKIIVFFCRFASGGSASTDFYSSNEKGVQKMSKQKTQYFLTFQITRERKYRFLHLK